VMNAMLFGTFDGLHMGHVWVVQNALAALHAKLYIVVARDATVAKVKGRAPKQGEKVRAAALGRLFPECRIVLGHMTDYMYWLNRLQPSAVFLGYDQHTFTGPLSSLGIPSTRIQPFNERVYKSSKIKTPHVLIRGKVVNGKKLGREIGYPTANIHLSAPTKRLVVGQNLNGIYVSRVLLGTQSYLGATVIGARTHKGAPLVETHIIDYHGDCYGQTVTVSLEKKLRDFKVYEDEEKLKNDIKNDINEVRAYFGQS
jgi:cytidyltransferase-like protein